MVCKNTNFRFQSTPIDVSQSPTYKPKKPKQVDPENIRILTHEREGHEYYIAYDVSDNDSVAATQAYLLICTSNPEVKINFRDLGRLSQQIRRDVAEYDTKQPKTSLTSKVMAAIDIAPIQKKDFSHRNALNKKYGYGLGDNPHPDEPLDFA